MADLSPSQRSDEWQAGYAAGLATLAPKSEPARSLFLNHAEALAMGLMHGTMGPGPPPAPPAADAPCASCGKPADTRLCHMGGCPLGADL